MFLSVGGGAVEPGGGSDDARLWAITSAPAENTDGIFSNGAPHSRQAVTGGIMHVLPKGKPLGTKQRFQTIFGLIFVDGHTLPFFLARSAPRHDPVLPGGADPPAALLTLFVFRFLKHRHPADQGPDNRTAKSPPSERAVPPLRPKPFRINRPFHPWINQHHISLRTGGQRPAR